MKPDTPFVGSDRDSLIRLARAMGRVDAMAFDVDGTLADASSYVPKSTISALARLANAGVQPVIITGRVYPAASKILHDAHCPGIVVASNGAVVGDCETDEILYQHPMEPEFSRGLIDLGRKHDLSITLFLFDSMVSDRDDFSARFLKDANEGLAVRIEDIDQIDPDLILKIMYAHPDSQVLDQLTPELLERFPDLQRSLDNYFEIVSPGEGKKKALHIVADKLGWDLERVAGFGDGGNDVHWMPETGWPIAVENARDEVKAIARGVIGHHNHGGVENFIDAYLHVHG